MKKIILLLTLISSPAFAKFQIGASIFDFNFKSDYRETQSDLQPNINLGYSLDFKPFFVSAQTNRLFNPERHARVEKNDINYDKITRAQIDTLSVGIVATRFMPSVFIARVDSTNLLYHNGTKVGSKRIISSAKGFALSYFITKNLYASAILVLPQSSLNLKTSGGLSVSYLF